jgi:hypothetical protein
MLVHFTDATSNNSIAVNPKFVVVVFTTKDDKGEVTVINTSTGNLAVVESYIDVVGRLQGEM